jgi:hypothetical protein
MPEQTLPNRNTTVKSRCAAAVLVILGACPAVAQDAPQAKPMRHTPGMDHAAMMAGMMPEEGGQSAFAAIQEIVALLMADPNTDWTKVNIEALRQHLIDMNNVTLEARVEAHDVAGGVTFAVSGNGAVGDSIRRMVMAHAATMNGLDGWSFTASPTEGGADLTVVPPPAVPLAEVKGLGFIGILGLGMHHQMHHLMIARGMSPHQ